MKDYAAAREYCNVPQHHIELNLGILEVRSLSLQDETFPH